MATDGGGKQGVRRSPLIRTFYERVRRKDPERRKIALVATAHYLFRAMMAMLRTGGLALRRGGRGLN